MSQQPSSPSSPQQPSPLLQSLIERGLDPSSPTIPVLGFGSLLSRRSAEFTFPDLTNFRLARLAPCWRRVFGHPASVFFERGIVFANTREFSSLAVEELEHSEEELLVPTTQLVVSCFDIPLSEAGLAAFREREEEFQIVLEVAEEVEIFDRKIIPTNEFTPPSLLCARWDDEAYVEAFGRENFDAKYGKWGCETVWHWRERAGPMPSSVAPNQHADPHEQEHEKTESPHIGELVDISNLPPGVNILPCRPYLRHCLLAAKKLGLYDNFLDTTYRLRAFVERRHAIASSCPQDLLLNAVITTTFVGGSRRPLLRIAFAARDRSLQWRKDVNQSG